jgi:anti-anti-sigma factor
MKVASKLFKDICVLEIDGEIDAEHATQLKKAIAKSREEHAVHFVLDLSHVTFIDSTGLGVLISLMRHLKENGGELRLVALQDEVRAIFEITRLFRVFEIFSNVEEAIQSIQKILET